MSSINYEQGPEIVAGTEIYALDIKEDSRPVEQSKLIRVLEYTVIGAGLLVAAYFASKNIEFPTRGPQP